MPRLRVRTVPGPLRVGPRDEVQSRGDEVLNLSICKRLSIHGHDARPLAAGELHAVRALDEPVVPEEGLDPAIKRQATSYELQATSY